jgi:prolyl-tRNA editing enzyme YbaK/EbsC (Cys-tRNA(Pro) deacylase)
MPIQKLQEFLDDHDVKYVVISHSVAYTAQGVAALTHISGKELAKTVIVKIDGALAMALLPASLHVDLSRLRSVCHRKQCCTCFGGRVQRAVSRLRNWSHASLRQSLRYARLCR